MAKGQTIKQREALKRGRPSKYDPSWMLPKLSEIGTGGGSNAEMAVALGISRDTFHEWCKQRPDFSDAVKRAELLSQAWWEQKGRAKTFESKEFSAVSYIFQMKNRFPADWRDRQTLEHTGKDGGPIQTQEAVVVLDASKLDPEARGLLREALKAAKG